MSASPRRRFPGWDLLLFGVAGLAGAAYLIAHFGYAAILGAAYEVSPVHLTVASAGLVPTAYAFAVFGVARARRGDGPVRSWPLLERSASGIASAYLVSAGLYLMAIVAVLGFKHHHKAVSHTEAGSILQHGERFSVSEESWWS